VTVKHYLARRSRDNCQNAVINLRNTFYIKNCKKTFLNTDFCNFRVWIDSFEVIDSCHVIPEDYLARRWSDNCQNTY